MKKKKNRKSPLTITKGDMIFKKYGDKLFFDSIKKYKKVGKEELKNKSK